MRPGAGVRDDADFIGVVTDSTACLPDAMIEPYSGRLVLVPLSVTIDGETCVEGDVVAGDDVAAAVQRRGVTVSTASPSPDRILQAYEELFARGARGIVSVHASASLSATFANAAIAGARASGPVTVLDSSTLGMAMGFAALDGAGLAASHADLAEVSARVASVCKTSTTAFTVDTLEPLRRGGRIGRASAFLGSALSIRPLLQVTDGVIAPMSRVRTTAKAVARLVEWTSAACTEREDAYRVAVHGHEGEALFDTALQALDAKGIRVVPVTLGAVVAAHVGAGAVAITVVDAASV